MGVLNIVEKVLKEAGEPLHYNEITKRSSGFWGVEDRRQDAACNDQRPA